MATISSEARVGPLLREWRTRRRRTQLDLALDAGISARHLSFVETGRSRPGREMLMRLAEELEIPFRERNQLLLAAGHAPAFPERSLDDPDLAPVREALDLILKGHEPYPAVVVDRAYNLVAANAAATVLVEGHRLLVDADLHPRLEKTITPVLSVWQRGAGRVGALTPDVMPHWAGGIIDWGEQRVKLPTGNEVGHLYPAFLVDLCRWLISTS